MEKSHEITVGILNTTSRSEVMTMNIKKNMTTNLRRELKSIKRIVNKSHYALIPTMPGVSALKINMDIVLSHEETKGQKISNLITINGKQEIEGDPCKNSSQTRSLTSKCSWMMNIKLTWNGSSSKA